MYIMVYIIVIDQTCMGKTVICVIERRNSVSTNKDVPQFKMTFLDILFLFYLELNLNTQIFWVHHQAFFF